MHCNVNTNLTSDPANLEHIIAMFEFLTNIQHHGVHLPLPSLVNWDGSQKAHS